MQGWISILITIRHRALRLRSVPRQPATVRSDDYDQLMAFGWKVLLPLAVVNLLATAAAVLYFTT